MSRAECADAAVESLDVGIVCWFSRLWEVQIDFAYVR